MRLLIIGILFLFFLLNKNINAQEINISFQENYTGRNLQLGASYYQKNLISFNGGLKMHFNTDYQENSTFFRAYEFYQYFGLYHQIKYNLPSLSSDNMGVHLFHNLQFNTLGSKTVGLDNIGFDAFGNKIFIEHIEEVPLIYSVENNIGVSLVFNATQNIKFISSIGTGFIYDYTITFNERDPSTGKELTVLGGSGLDWFTYQLGVGIIYKFKQKD